MELDCQDCAIELAQTQVLRVRAASGVTVRCDSGIVWVTQEGVVRDDFLRAGESLRIVSGGVTLVEAVGGTVAMLALHPARGSGRDAGGSRGPVLRSRLDIVKQQAWAR